MGEETDVIKPLCTGESVSGWSLLMWFWFCFCAVFRFLVQPVECGLGTLGPAGQGLVCAARRVPGRGPWSSEVWFVFSMSFWSGPRRGVARCGRV